MQSVLDLVEQRRFRLDLFYRLNGVEVQIPPLRRRRDDIIELARYFLDRHRRFRPPSLSTAATDALLALTLAVFVAGYVPARRATSIDAAATLRAE